MCECTYVWKPSYGSDYPVVCVCVSVSNIKLHPFLWDIIWITCKNSFRLIYIFSTYFKYFLTSLLAVLDVDKRGNFGDWFRVSVCCITLRICSRCYWFVQHRGVILSCWIGQSSVRVAFFRGGNVSPSHLAVWPITIDQFLTSGGKLLHKWKGRVRTHRLQFVSSLLTNRSQFSSCTPMWQWNRRTELQC